ncbi:MAG: methionine synthase [Bacteroidales bacterium OttesenSCG-928-I14]|jgi:5-methyltetrahydrofolate--homocysteine methyltransferase|nr:methionine synthase [Bacteroidales bacterium OttesenSCG-928-I14]
MDSIYKLLKERILILDGGMGSIIQSYELKDTDYRGKHFTNLQNEIYGNGDVLCITRPDIVQSIHRAYLEAGADIIETNSMNMTTISMADYGIESYVGTLNKAAATIAKEMAEKYTKLTPNKPRFVAGSIGPTNKALSISPDVNNPNVRDITFDDLYNSYCTQIAALIFGGVDLLLIETAFDTLNVKAALMAAENEMKIANKKLPLMVSYTLAGNSGRILSGQTLEAAFASISHIDLLSIGLNCSFGAKSMKPFLKKLGQIAHCYISAYPNAGLPNALGEYDESPKMMADQVYEYINESLVNIIGGCCGTTPEHISAIANLVKKCKKPIRTPFIKNYELTLSGLETLHISNTNSNCKKPNKNPNFIIIGECCNVAGSRKFLRLIQEKKYEEALKIARSQVENNAKILDINVDDSLLNSAHEITTFLNFITSDPITASVPIMIDSSDWNVIETALKCLQGKSIVNSISLKNGENDFLNKAKKIKFYGAAVVAMAFDEKGQAVDFDRKITICERMYKLLTNGIGFQPSDIIFDPNILAIATGLEVDCNYTIDFIRTIKWIKKYLPFAKVSGGISNLSFSFRNNNYLREAIHSVFISHAINAGMDMGILNPNRNFDLKDIPLSLIKLIENMLFNCSQSTVENLIEYIQKKTISPSKKENKNEWRTFSVIERLKYSIINGIDDFLKTDLQEAIKIFPQVINIIDQPLMNGINTVSDLFSEGKIFLPQLVKTARIMKKAVTILQPYIIENKKNVFNKSGKILFATVKGDVHDIGKNIVCAILSCNNYEVIDAGIMVPSEEIIRKAKKYQVDIIALSGLITPSLKEMSVVASEMEKAGLSIPLLIGGATTSKLHTALKIAPLYNGAVVHVTDASKAVLTVNKLLHSSNKNNYIKEIKDTYSFLRQNANNSNELVPFDYARKHSLKINHAEYNTPKPIIEGTKILNFIQIKNILPYINWGAFLTTWKFPIQYSFPILVENQVQVDQQNKLKKAIHLINEAKKLLSTLIKSDPQMIRAIIGFYPVKVKNESLIIKNRNIPLLRQQKKREDNIYKSLVDFINPIGDYIGFFVVTAGSNINSSENTYKSMLEQILRNHMAEAAAEYLHEKVRKKYWGYAPNESFHPKELLKIPYQGIRPASGYAANPDISFNFIIDDLLKMWKIGVKLTPNGAICPTASIAGMYIAHPKAKYFHIGEIDSIQLSYYAKKKNISVDEAKKWLGGCTVKIN